MREQSTDNKLPVTKGHQKLIISDFDDLVFEKRNREYGAYQLRKRYYKVLLAGTLIACLLGTFAVLIPFLSRPDSESVVLGGAGYVRVQFENLQPPEEIYVPPSAPPPETAKNQQNVKYVPPVVVDSVSPIDLIPMSTDEVLASVESEMTGAAGSGFGDDLLAGGDGGNLEEPLFQVEVMPTFRGGDLNNFRTWVGKRTNYPQAAIDNKIRGTVFLTFVVEKDGSVSNVIILKGVHPLLDEEAVKAISESPKWTPGLQRGQPVRVRFQIPLSFTY